jgi:flagellar biosynthetic protein FlhB
MSEEGFDKTEQPTQRRRDDAVGTVGLWWTGAALASGLSQEIQSHLRTPRVELSVGDIPAFITDLGTHGLQLIGGFMAVIFAVGLIANLAQAGLHLNTESLGPKWEKLNPAMNWHKIFSTEGLMRGALSIAKVALVGVVAWWVLSDRGQQIAALSTGVLSQTVSTAWGIGIELLIAASSVLLLLGAIDYGWQWYNNEQKLRMSREELKRERKDDEGDPNIQMRRRQRAREIVSQRRMLEEIPKATLIITNPTHLAIALRYERGVNSAPVVIAKGRDQFALQIAARARRHGIPVVERKPVARALFKMVKVGQEIPQTLYVAVSEVLGYVYRLRNVA